MAEGDSTAAAEGGTGDGSGGQDTITNAIPEAWAQTDYFKDFYGENGSFDFEKFGESYSADKSKIAELSQNQPQLPESADDYKFDFGENPTYPVDEADVKLQRELAKELGLTQAQYEGLVKFDLGRVSRAAEEIENGAKQAREQLVKDWGGQQKFEANLAAAAKVATAIFGKEFADRADLGNDPQLIKGLYLISTKLSEDTLKDGSGTASGPPIGEDGEPLLVYGKP